MFATQETMRTTFVPATSHARPASVTAKEEWLDCHAPIKAILAAMGFRLAGNHDDDWQYYVAAIGNGKRTIYRVASVTPER